MNLLLQAVDPTSSSYGKIGLELLNLALLIEMRFKVSSLWKWRMNQIERAEQAVAAKAGK